MTKRWHARWRIRKPVRPVSNVGAMIVGIDNTKDLLEATAYGSAILATIAGAVAYLVRSRKKAIEATRQLLVRSWTNEGDVNSEETVFVQLNLANREGDIVGQLESSRLVRPLDVSCKIGWWSSKLDLYKLRGRELIPVASIKVRITGNNNRLRWKPLRRKAVDFLPLATTLWPSTHTGVWL